MAQNEDRASAELIMLTRLGGNFIDEWIKTQISLFLPSFAHDNIVGTSEHETVSRALMALPAIPWLRGLAKAVRGEQVGSVLQNIAAKFKTVTVKFREKKRMGSLRSLSTAVEMGAGTSMSRAKPRGSLSLARVNSENITDTEKKKEKSRQENFNDKADLHSIQAEMRSRRRSSVASIDTSSVKVGRGSLLMGDLDNSGGFNSPKSASIL